MLIFNIQDYDDFKYLFGMESHGNGVKSRKNKILLQHIKNPALIKYCREHNDFSLLHIRNMADLKLTSIKVIENGTTFYLGKLKAWVLIQYERSVNNFSVIVRPDDGGNEIVYHSVSLDNLVSVIDANVKYGTASYDYICEICNLTPRVAV